MTSIRNQSRLKNEVICGHHVREFGERYGFNSLEMQFLLGMHGPTYAKITNHLNESEPVSERLYSASLRMLDLICSSEYFQKMSFAELMRKPTLNEFIAACTQKRIKVGKSALDPDDNAEGGVLMLRGYGAARNLLKGIACPTVPLTRWMGLVMFCLDHNKVAWVEDVIATEAQVNGVDIKELLVSAWPTFGAGRETAGAERVTGGRGRD